MWKRVCVSHWYSTKFIRFRLRVQKSKAVMGTLNTCMQRRGCNFVSHLFSQNVNHILKTSWKDANKHVVNWFIYIIVLIYDIMVLASVMSLCSDNKDYGDIIYVMWNQLIWTMISSCSFYASMVPRYHRFMIT